MKRSILTATALLLGHSLATFAQTEERLAKQFPAQPGGMLVIDVDAGSIDIRTNATSEVIVDVVRKITRATKVEEEAYLADRPVEVTADGETVKIETRARTRNTVASKGRQRTEIKYTVTVPARFNAQIKTAAGAVAVSDLSGEFKIGSGGGGLDLVRLHGPLDASTSAGAIRVTNCAGDQRVKTSGGGIEVTGGSGSLDGATAGGLVAVRDFRGPVQVKSSGGGITVDNVAGKLEGKTGGGAIAARFATPPSNEVRLATSGGGVTLRVPAESAFDLDASTAGGSVSSDLVVHSEGKPSRSHVKGAINGGGKPVVLRTGGGSIQVLKQ